MNIVLFYISKILYSTVINNLKIYLLVLKFILLLEKTAYEFTISNKNFNICTVLFDIVFFYNDFFSLDPLLTFLYSRGVSLGVALPQLHHLKIL